MVTSYSPNYYLQALIKANKLKRNQTLFHRIEHGGYGAIASRLMTGLNISLALESNYSFFIDSPYELESMFEIKVKKPIELLQNQEIIEWNFLEDTWNAPPKIKADHQYPACPLDVNQGITRHQWCSVLAHAICGSPTQFLKIEIDRLKKQINWDSYNLHIGLHIRKGDKNSECPYIPIESYLVHIRNLIKSNPFKQALVFLSSDDPLSLVDVRAKLNDARIEWDDLEIRYNNFNAGMVASNPALANQESITAAKNISLLGECDYVVGMSYAQFTWLGGLLSVFKNHFDVNRHIMIDPHNGLRGHWATYYGFPLNELI